MTTVPNLLAELAGAGVRLRLVDDARLEVSAPKGSLRADLRDRIVRHKPELIEWLAGLADTGAGDLPVITHDAAALREPFAPSDLQTSFIIGSREGFEHHVRPHQYMEWEFAELDPARYEAALNQVLRRQRKDLVVVRDDLRLQAVGDDPAPVKVTVSDLAGMTREAAEAEIARVRAAMERHEPDISRWPWVEAHISRYGDGRARLHWNNNNLFSDAPGTMGFLANVMRAYDDPASVRDDLEIGYRDCVLALAELEESPEGRAAERYWRERIPGWPEAPAVPLAAGADLRRRSLLVRRELLFPADLWARLRGKAEARGLTKTNVVLAAHAELLSYWSGSRHFLINNMITHRVPLHPQIGQVLGNFASLYPLEADWRHDEPFTARARRLQSQVISDVEHSQWSGVKVLQALNSARRTPGRAVCPFAVGSALFVGATERPDYSTLETPQVRFDCEFWELPDGSLWVVWDVIEEMFPEGLIDAMEEGYRTALTALADGDAAWEAPGLDLLPADQRAQRALPAPPATPVGGFLHDALPARAAQAPGAPAVIADGATLTYAELQARSAELAARLRAGGVTDGARVAVVLPKGPDQIVAVFAALAAGAAYVPMDPGWPEDRIGYLLGDIEAAAVLTGEDRLAAMASLTGAPVLPVTPPGGAEPAAASAGGGDRTPADLAYVIYTSGSTGRPKGVMLDHRGPLNTVRDINSRFGIGPDDVVFGISSLCFDLSVYDVFGTAAAGAALVLPTASAADPGAWLDLVGRHGVTVWNSVPAIMQLFTEAAEAAGATFPQLRTVLLSGDWIPVQLPDRIRRIAPNARVVSLGGATEASIWSICHPVDHVDPEWTSIPYGRPLAGQSWHILDDLGRDAPTWVPGHLYIGGAGLALGYLGDQAKTDAAFVTHPRTGERVYRTGDLGRHLPDGTIEFLGRADFQVKIQGFRVEPGEVEQTLLEHPDVAQAAVVARSTGSGKQLAAYVVGHPDAAPDGALTSAALRDFAARCLPSYLVPAHITVLPALPLTANGKLDRRALEALGPADEGGGAEHVAPRTPAEAAIAEVWAQTLEAERVGVHDDFFDLGGQSFAALRVIERLAATTGRRIPLGVLLEQRTVAGLARWLETAQPQWSPLVRLTHRPSGTPWFLVHPAGGNVLCYEKLADLLDAPVHAFQAPTPSSGGGPLDKVEDFAGHYLEALLAVQPHGPYRLGGWSSGGVIAFELAHLLEARGESVERLAVLDSPSPTVPRALDDTRLLLWFVEDLGLGFRAATVAEDEVLRLAALPDPRALAEVLALAGAAAAGIDPASLADPLAVFRGVVRACNSYAAPTVAADLVVVRAGQGEVGEFAGHPAAAAPDWGWAALTSGSVTGATVPATHYTLLTPRHAAAVAEAISRPRQGA
ncbi:non-ribosomal peptide synthetase [Actinacidiphila paucisporea]|uniref:Amino acid adenylation domain-containing protein n=1 Tax=Actinacidiphila paucisporea TaxID=310782 RepID=A0A1M7G6P2_9ACTN|nr:non-ribosomal peptide synthetase [Actinacidiphila paucisporea]SHM11856.1 amino acid adenylation domain-containing protein [Actinacidiphila paucisporea]